MARGGTQRLSAGTVKVDGLRELNQALKGISREAAKELRTANKTVATFVSEDARAAAYSIGGVAAHVAPSIRASAGAQFAGVAFGGPGWEMAGGAEFGSLRFKQFKPWRGNGSDAGYFLYPAIRQDAARITTEYVHALDHLLRRNGLA